MLELKIYPLSIIVFNFLIIAYTPIHNILYSGSSCDLSG